MCEQGGPHMCEPRTCVNKGRMSLRVAVCRCMSLLGTSLTSSSSGQEKSTVAEPRLTKMSAALPVLSALPMKEQPRKATSPNSGLLTATAPPPESAATRWSASIVTWLSKNFVLWTSALESPLTCRPPPVVSAVFVVMNESTIVSVDSSVSATPPP